MAPSFQLEWNIQRGDPPTVSVIKQEASWLLEKSIKLPSGVDLQFQVGTRDSVLDYHKSSFNGKILSDFALRRKYR